MAVLSTFIGNPNAQQNYCFLPDGRLAVLIIDANNYLHLDIYTLDRSSKTRYSVTDSTYRFLYTTCMVLVNSTTLWFFTTYQTQGLRRLEFDLTTMAFVVPQGGTSIAQGEIIDTTQHSNDLGGYIALMDANGIVHVIAAQPITSMGNTTDQLWYHRGQPQTWYRRDIVATDFQSHIVYAKLTPSGVPVVSKFTQYDAGDYGYSVCVGNGNLATSFTELEVYRGSTERDYAFKPNSNRIFSLTTDFGGSTLTLTSVAIDASSFTTYNFTPPGTLAGISSGTVIWQFIESGTKIRFMYRLSTDAVDVKRIGVISDLAGTPTVDWNGFDGLTLSGANDPTQGERDSQWDNDLSFLKYNREGVLVDYLSGTPEYTTYLNNNLNDYYFTEFDYPKNAVIPIGETLAYNIELQIAYVQAISPNVTVPILEAVQFTETVNDVTVSTPVVITVDSSETPRALARLKPKKMDRTNTGRPVFLSNTGELIYNTVEFGAWQVFAPATGVFNSLASHAGSDNMLLGWEDGAVKTTLINITNQANTSETVSADAPDAGTVFATLDANNKQHVFWVFSEKVMGTTTFVGKYTNNISGSFKTPVEVFRETSTVNAWGIGISESNKPVLHYYLNRTGYDGTFIGSANDATSFSQLRIDIGPKVYPVVTWNSADAYFYCHYSSGTDRLYFRIGSDNWFITASPNLTNFDTTISHNFPLVLRENSFFFLYYGTDSVVRLAKVTDAVLSASGTDMTAQLEDKGATHNFAATSFDPNSDSFAWDVPEGIHSFGKDGVDYPGGVGTIPTIDILTKNGGNLIWTEFGLSDAAPGAVTVTPEAIDFAINQLPAEVVLEVPDASIVVAADTIGFIITQEAATVIIPVDVSVTADLQAFTLTAEAVTLNTEAGATVAADLQAFTETLLDVTVVTTEAVTVSADLLGYTYTAEIVDVLTEEGVLISADTIGYTETIYDAVVGTDTSVSVAAGIQEFEVRVLPAVTRRKPRVLMSGGRVLRF